MRKRITYKFSFSLIFLLCLAFLQTKADIIPELSKDTLKFGNVASCERPRDTVVVRNPSTSTANFKLLVGEKITGLNSSSFKITNLKLKDLDLPPYDGSNAVIYVVEFDPSVGTTGAKEAVLEIPTDLTNMPIIKIPITGYSEQINYILNPDPINYGDIATGTNYNLGFSFEVQSNLTIHISKITKAKNEITTDLTGFDYNLTPTSSQRNINININLGNTGKFSDTLKIYIDSPCDTVLSIPILANGLPSAISALLNYDFGLLSKCENKDTVVILTFSGSGSGKIESVGVITGALAKLYSVSFESALPITLNSGNPTAKMTISFKGDGNTKGLANINIPVNITVNGNSSTMNFTSTADIGDIKLDQDKTLLDFGTIFAFTSQSLNLNLNNNTKFDINITNYKFTGNFPALFDFNPVFAPFLLKKGDLKQYTIFFNPVLPKINAVGKLVIYYNANNCSDSVVVDVQGNTFDSGALKISFNNQSLYEVDPKTASFSLPLTMKPLGNTVLLDDSLSVEITFPRSVFYPESIISNFPSRVDNNTINGNLRTYSFTIFFNKFAVPTNVETEIAKIQGIPLLGDIKESKFDISKVELKSGNKFVSIDSLIGTTLRLIICERGGERLLKVTQIPNGGIIKIENINDNDISLSCFLLEKGMNEISLIDLNGQILESKRFYSNSNSTEKITFNSSQIPNGVYFILLETVSDKYSLKIIK